MHKGIGRALTPSSAIQIFGFIQFRAVFHKDFTNRTIYNMANLAIVALNWMCVEEVGCELERLGRNVKGERKRWKTWIKKLVEVILEIQS